jgi:hypothetical protein
MELNEYADSLGSDSEKCPESTLECPVFVANKVLSLSVDLPKLEIVATDHAVKLCLGEHDVSESDQHPNNDNSQSEINEHCSEVDMALTFFTVCFAQRKTQVCHVSNNAREELLRNVE